MARDFAAEMAAKKDAAKAAKAAKSEAKKQAQEAKKQAKAEAKERGEPVASRWEMGDEYWARIFFVLGSGYAFLALFNITLGNFSRCFEEAERDGRPMPIAENLKLFVRMSVGVSYIYLFIYGWMLVGPIKFKGRMLYLNVAHGLFLATSLGLWGFGTFVVLDSWGPTMIGLAPVTFWSALTSVASFWITLVFTLVKVVRHILRMNAKHRQEAKWAKLKEDVAVEVEEETAAAAAKKESESNKKKEEVEKAGGTYDARFDDSDSD